ncbi:MAG: protein translocase SEC61 complex subunit gamma [Nanoarchaeota archaeon]
MLNNIRQKISSFFTQCVRVWQVLRKPDSQEFKSIAKVSALGILILGLIGFFITLLMNLV